MKAYFSKAFEINLKKQDLSVKGWNRGDVMFENGQLAFLLDEKPSFEIPLRNVTKCDTAGKNEVGTSLKFRNIKNKIISFLM